MVRRLFPGRTAADGAAPIPLDQTGLGKLRWRTTLFTLCVAALAMLAQVLIDLDEGVMSTLDDSVFWTFVGFAALALWQGLLRRPSATVERLGLLVAVGIFLFQYTEIVRGVFSGGQTDDLLVEVVTWTGVIYAIIFIFFPIRQALAVAGSVFAFTSVYWGHFTFRVGVAGEPSYGVDAFYDQVASGLILLFLLTILKRVTNLGAQAQARGDALAQLANTDSLTGLHNRRYLDRALNDAFKRALRFEHPLSVALCDIDFFKAINDALSHAVGDETLRVFADILRRNTREVDILVRYGGEEFVIVFLETDEAQAVRICEKLRGTIQAHEWFLVHPELQVTASFGVTSDLTVASYEKMLSAADDKLYEAKRGGKNQVRV